VSALKATALASLAALLFPLHAQATLRLHGSDVRPRHWNWAREAQKHVPLPDARIRIWSGYPASYAPAHRELYLPRPGLQGTTYWDERIALLHEFGHAFDFSVMDWADRRRFRTLVQTRCGWLSRRCHLSGLNVPPVEMFADAYSACALGMTLREGAPLGLASYGWFPPEGTDATLCSLIRSFA
jgi:hypothetical protein